ncbi:MAG: hypothetical protein Q9184_005857 [Pyrenodesmia sp. 2 TL-2023]
MAISNTADDSGAAFLSTNSNSNNSLAVFPTSVSDDTPKSQLTDVPWKALLKVNIRIPAVFKNVLLRTLPYDGVSGYPLNRHHLDDDVPVMVHGSKTYYLRPDYTVLMHDAPAPHKGANTWFVQLFYDQRLGPNEQQRLSPFGHADRASGDFFLPLGSLVETKNDEGEKRLTNYCWALNVSTDPVSLWLVFDYVMVTPSGDDATIEISEVYLNERNELDNYAYAFEKVPQAAGYLGLDSAWDVIKVFDNVEEDWQPENAIAAQLDDAERRWELGSTIRAYALHKPPVNASRLRYFEAEKS